MKMTSFDTKTPTDAYNPSEEQAFRLVDEAAERRKKYASSGFDEKSWKKHSLGVALIAKKIAAEAGLDQNRAFISGLLHDIGKRWNENTENVFHGLSGFYYLKAFGFDQTARVCLTHSFPTTECSENLLPNPDPIVNHAKKVLQTLGEYDAYDRLIQLCDWLNDCGTDCSVEYRTNSIIRRYPQIPAQKTLILADAVKKIKNEFDTLCGKDILKICNIAP